eukprot:GFUD01015888.1.p1 GENE.GFUD01015888.1~~GFUD01015888.1.p1  ORF type:complete len:256 (+),score=55.87 GFUD01015888.1:82-849(+)
MNKMPDMSNVSINSIIPVEILQRIFCLLPRIDLRIVVLVCRMWRDIGEDAILWTRGPIFLSSRDDLFKLDIRRLKYAQEIRVRCQLESLELEELLRVVIGLPKLKIIGLNCYNLSSVDPDLLAMIVNSIDTVVISDCNLTNQQVETIFATISEDTKLKKLWIHHNNLSTVEPAVLATAVSKIEVVNLMITNLTGQQTTCLLTQATGPGSKLQRLVLNSPKDEQLDEQIIKQARDTIKELDFYRGNMAYGEKLQLV